MTFSPRVLVLLAVVFAASSSSVFAQAPTGAERGGFTLLLNGGLGWQNDQALESTAWGLGGLNLGLGGFVTPKLAILGRISGTVATHTLLEDTRFETDYQQVSGVGGVTLQYWPNDRIAVEAGPGMGFWSGNDDSESGFGLVIGLHVTLLNRGKHNLQLGIESAPAFTDAGNVANVGFTIGYQLF